MPSATSRALVVAVCVFTVVTAPALAVPANTQVESRPSVTSTIEPNATDAFAEVPPAESVHQLSQPANTITIRSTGDERANYTITVSGRIEPASAADLTDAEVPDSASGARATGSTAEGGIDNFSFTGRITALDIDGGPVNVFINGEQVDPGDFPGDTDANSDADSDSDANRNTDPDSDADANRNTDPDSDADANRNTDPDANRNADTDADSDTNRHADADADAHFDTGPGNTHPVTDGRSDTDSDGDGIGGRIAHDNPNSDDQYSERERECVPAGESGILSGVNLGTLAFVFGFIVLVIFAVAAVVARYNRSLPKRHSMIRSSTCTFFPLGCARYRLRRSKRLRRFVMTRERSSLEPHRRAKNLHQKSRSLGLRPRSRYNHSQLLEHLQILLDNRPLLVGQLEQLIDRHVDVGLQRLDVRLRNGRFVGFERRHEFFDTAPARRHRDCGLLAAFHPPAIDGGVGWIAHPEEILQRASHALVAGDGSGDTGVWVVDPLDADGIDDLLAELGTVAGVVVLSNHHRRDGAAIANRHDVSVHLPHAMQGVAATLDRAGIAEFGPELGDTGYELLTVNFTTGWQEFALYDGETLVVSEAIGTAPHFLTGDERLGVITALRLLPPQAALGGLDPERILVSHGEGIFEDATAGLTDALASSRRRFPHALLENGSDQLRTLAAVLRT